MKTGHTGSADLWRERKDVTTPRFVCIKSLKTEDLCLGMCEENTTTPPTPRHDIKLEWGADDSGQENPPN